ncbi:tRNA pseudouridine(38-40) synthase TruA [Mucilaginibacter polytrichastri]|uniref:tRNA pseudouridine synthase A n=1 Tax=Mucilaginibacter polytrichastri TaxID=1302689 RepID=A0A1Q6A1X7_9SPHI|nr:tRNA pseudouridine(38-40) synthase TruA [Mucilaginibacter polytrichastri]OKS88013.1 tRNA pseudouridine synthase A [Mucilaginibacter polytrichastri]SFT27043.1 tRNA pseudouridine38-40 synthase [Mucilaginibacter polytrichastri]
MAQQRYFIELAYNGTNYHGWQIQPNAIAVQQVLNHALTTLLRHPVETLGCGRTDTGVHATEFFAHLDIDSESENPKFEIRSLNALLPYDIAVKRIIPVHPEAHARFDATLRSYEYHIHFHKDPFKLNYSWLLRDKPDMELMNEGAMIMMEYIDFSCFSKSNTQVFTNNCKISRAEWGEAADGSLIFHISADRFLRNMVRAIVGTLLMVGKREIEPEAIRQIIESKNRSKAGTSVPACGLYLTEVVYPYLPPSSLKGK